MRASILTAASAVFLLTTLSSVALAQPKPQDERPDPVSQALALVKEEKEKAKDGIAPIDFSSIRSFDDLICRLNETEPDIARSLVEADPGRSADITALDVGVTGFMQGTSFLPPDAGASFLREKFEEHGCNWRGVVPGPEEVPAFLTRDDLITGGSGLNLATSKALEAEFSSFVPPTDDKSTPFVPVPAEEVPSVLPSSGGQSEPRQGLARASKVNAICEKYSNLDHSPECVSFFAAEEGLLDESFTIYEYCAAATSGADPSVAMGPVAVVEVVMLAGYLAYSAVEVYQGEHEGWNNVKRWDANSTITGANETISAANDRQQELTGGDRDVDTVTEAQESETMSDEAKEEYTHLELEKLKAESDKANAQKVLDDLAAKKKETEPYKQALDCSDPEVLASLEEGFAQYKRQVEGIAKQCRREIDDERAEVIPDAGAEQTGNCDLKALRDDVTKANADLTDPDVIARLEQEAEQYRFERQAAWNNISCSEACIQGGGECTLDNHNKQICVPASEFYGTPNYEERIDQLISEGGNTGDEQPKTLEWVGFGLDQELEEAVAAARSCASPMC